MTLRRRFEVFRVDTSLSGQGSQALTASGNAMYRRRRRQRAARRQRCARCDTRWHRVAIHAVMTASFQTSPERLLRVFTDTKNRARKSFTHPWRFLRCLTTPAAQDTDATWHGRVPSAHVRTQRDDVTWKASAGRPGGKSWLQSRQTANPALSNAAASNPALTSMKQPFLTTLRPISSMPNERY